MKSGSARTRLRHPRNVSTDTFDPEGATMAYFPRL